MRHPQLAAEVGAVVARLRAAGFEVSQMDNGAITIIAIAPKASTDAHELLSLDEARVLGRFKTTRPIREAGRAGELPLYGTERTRTVKRAEFVAWLDSRRVKPIAIRGAAADDIDRRVRRLERVGSAG